MGTNATAGQSMIQPIISTQLCREETCEGFDNNMGKTWIYPANKTRRSYQFDIIQRCLFNNTMVVLPTGLGKTFIAAVVMFNMYRWYPVGKIIFLAPTKPLVAQQKTSCLETLEIHEEDTIEMTDQLLQKSRMALWRSKRVFFATPQVVQNDLDDPNFPASAIKLIIFDECHKAKGKYAYCEIVKKLHQLNPYFRKIALSATPGCTINDVVQVVQNLKISEIEIRHADSPDVAQYMHNTKVTNPIVPEKDESIIISDEEDGDKSILSPVGGKKENTHRKINLFEKRFDQNKFYSSSSNGKSFTTKERFALIDITNLIGDVQQIRKEVDDLKKVKKIPGKIEIPVSVYPETIEQFKSQNLSSLCFKTDSLGKMTQSKLSTWYSPTSDSGRFELNVNTVDDLFEGSWKSEGNLGTLDHWKVNMEQTKESNDISEIFSQSVLDGLSSLQTNLKQNDNSGLRCTTPKDDTFNNGTPEIQKFNNLSLELSPSILGETQMSPEAKLNESDLRCKTPQDDAFINRTLENQKNHNSPLKLSQSMIQSKFNENKDLPDTEELHRIPATISPSIFDVKNRRRLKHEVTRRLAEEFKDDETIESSQNYQEISRRAPRLRRLLYGNNSKTSSKKNDSNELQNKMSSSLNNELEISNVGEDKKRSAKEHFDPNNVKDLSLLLKNNLVDIDVFETEEHSINSQSSVTKMKPRQKKNKCNNFLDNEAEVSHGCSSDELEDDDLLDDSVIDHSFNESAFNNSTKMTEIYLRSVKNQPNIYGFKIPEARTYSDASNILSQDVLPDDSVMEDSFITESVEINTEMDDLDRAEAIIKERSKKRKRRINRVEVTSAHIKKRKYFVVSSDSSSES